MSDELSSMDALMDDARRFRETWPAGPWDHEPDEWVGPVDYLSGVATYARRQAHLGHWCGYIHVPPRHPLHGVAYDEAHVECHWGATYAGEPLGDVGPRDGWAIGFDCGHAFDATPGLMAAYAAADSSSAGRLLAKMKAGVEFEDLLDDAPDPFKPRYRTLEYVQGELLCMLRQVTHKVTVPGGKVRRLEIRTRGVGRPFVIETYPRRLAKRVPRGPGPLSVRYLHR